jgi:cytochrome c oxidase subunit 2
MGLVVVAHTPQEFAAWRARQAGPAVALDAAAPTAAMIARGRDVFAASGCGACHTIRGTEANGLAGPDLTHVGSRQTIGAGILPNNQGTLAGWISDSQGINPGNRMPSYPVLTGQDLRAVSAYLDSLK